MLFEFLVSFNSKFDTSLIRSCPKNLNKFLPQTD